MRTVMKFGGSVLSAVEDFQRLAAIVKARRRRGEQILVVNSALNGVTDQLIEAAGQALTNEAQMPLFVEGLRERHEALLDEIRGKAIAGQSRAAVGRKLHRLEKILSAVHALGSLSPQTKDLVYSFGERLSAPLIEAWLKAYGIQARAWDADEAGIVTDSCFGRANPQMKSIGKNFKKIARQLKSKVVIVTGYFGVDGAGNATCFGRGGSDFSAGIIANAVDADALELWKDVGCFYSADHRIVKNARKIGHLSYEEAEELGYFGAKIIHPRTIPPLKEKGIPALVKSVLKPKAIGTRITAKARKSHAIVKAIAAKKNVSLITVRSASMVDAPGYLSRVFGALSERGISVDMVSTSEASVSFTIERKDSAAAAKAVEELLHESERACIENDVAVIGVIGEAIRSTPGVLGKVCSVLGNAHINIEALSQGASEINLMLVVKESEVGKAVQCLHRKLVEGKT